MLEQTLVLLLIGLVTVIVKCCVVDTNADTTDSGLITGESASLLYLLKGKAYYVSVGVIVLKQVCL
jgi:hypothetical protein